MGAKNTIFGSKRKAPVPVHFPAPTEPEKPRKKRSDAKRDIKFRLTQEEKQTLQLEALKIGMKEPAFINKIVKEGLYEHRSREFPPYPFASEGVYLRVKLEEEFVPIVHILHIEWGLSYRKVVHRIIKDYLHGLLPIPIHHYQTGRVVK